MNNLEATLFPPDQHESLYHTYLAAYYLNLEACNLDRVEHVRALLDRLLSFKTIPRKRRRRIHRTVKAELASLHARK